MAANLEYQLLSRIVELQDFHTVEKLKISYDYFFAPECREVFRYIWDHFHARDTQGSVPSLDIIQKWYPSFPHTPSKDTVATLCDQIRLSKLRSQLHLLAQDVALYADSDPKGAIGLLREAAATLGNQHERSDGMLLSQSYQKLYEQYKLVAEKKGLTGLPWPWEVLNEETQGIHNGEFIVLYGRPKSMKTWVGLAIGVNVYEASNSRVLMYSPEMPIIQVIRRAAALLAKVDYQKLKKGQLNPYDEARFFERLQSLSAEEGHVGTEGHNPAFLITRDTGEDGGGISSLHAKIREFNPDLLIVDSFYLLKDDRQKTRSVDWKAITHISQDLKRTAAQFDIPIIGITQANRSAAKTKSSQSDLTELAYADAISQDCDLAIRVSKVIDAETRESEIHFGFPGARESKLEAFVTHGVPATNFGFKRAYLEGDALPSNVEDTNPNGATQSHQVPQIPTKRLRS